jgi:hypothetical protein
MQPATNSGLVSGEGTFSHIGYTRLAFLHRKVLEPRIRNLKYNS